MPKRSHALWIVKADTIPETNVPEALQLRSPLGISITTHKVPLARNPRAGQVAGDWTVLPFPYSATTEICGKGAADLAASLQSYHPEVITI